MNDYLHNYITDYFTRYLPGLQKISHNTITSYKYTFIQLLEYIKEKGKININTMKVSDLNENLINEFIEYLQMIKNNSISTTNQKLCAIHSFCNYLQKKNIEFLTITSEILSIKTQICEKKTIYYLTKDETKKLFQVFNITNKKQLRDYAIIATLYDSGARVQELIDLEARSIDFQNNTIRLHGKRNKTRLVPLSSQVIDILTRYFKEFSIVQNSNNIIFYNNRKEKLTREGIKYIIKKYSKLAELDYTKITPHTFRHTKAMHLLENDVNLVYIRDFLGHESVVITEIYAKANPEVKRKAIENLSNELIDNKKYSDEKKDELLTWLKLSL